MTSVIGKTVKMGYCRCMGTPRFIVLLSDSTGDLGERFIRALISQFPKHTFLFRVYSFIQNESELNDVFQELGELHPILFHTTLNLTLKERIKKDAASHSYPCYDLTGGAMTFLEASSGVKAVPNAALLHELNQDYEQRIRSLDFTVDHDDGVHTATIREADIVLLGVSRTSKTPTSIYLAYKGYKVANVPIVKGLPLPEALLNNRRLRTVGLHIAAEKLQAIRSERARADGIPFSDYTQLDAIRSELVWAQALFREMGCPVIDVTSHAVEETAALVLKSLDLR